MPNEHSSDEQAETQGTTVIQVPPDLQAFVDSCAESVDNVSAKITECTVEIYVDGEPMGAAQWKNLGVAPVNPGN